MDDKTIFALSSGRPPAAIAVVRISGTRALEAARALGATLAKPRMLALQRLRDPQDGNLLDEALVTWFPAAGSVTGEDLVELHLHGGPATVAAVESALGGLPGLRAAEPGEFTYRAFQHGKLDLLQVEGLSHLLRAETDSQRRLALATSGGALSGLIRGWQTRLLQLSALVEAMIDHSDEGDVRPDDGAARRIAKDLLDEIEKLLVRPTADRLYDGIRVAIAGPPNAGKSTLINALSQRDAAITSPIPGTTRDLIEVPVRFGGFAFILIDMAGVRDGTDDPIERIGIDRARREMADADIVLWLGDDNPPKGAIHIYSRSDEVGRTPLRSRNQISISALTGINIDRLLKRLIEIAHTIVPREGDNAVTARQHGILSILYAELDAYMRSSDPLLGAEHLRTGRRALDQLTGASGTEDMLDALFGTFCIGK